MAPKKQNDDGNFFSRDQAERFSETLKALGHPVRLQIVDILSNGPKSVTELSELIEQQQAIISQQLKILRLSDLVVVKRAQGKAFYSLAFPNLITLLNCLRSCQSHLD